MAALAKPQLIPVCMPRKLLKRWTPDAKKIRETPGLGFLGKLLHDPNLFHLTRHSVSVAFLVGLFVCFLPTPGQIGIAAGAALIVRCNLPIAVALVWLSNPITIPFIAIGAYQVGARLLGRPPTHFDFEPTWEWLTTGFLTVWEPLVLGCITFGVFFGLLGYLMIQWFWRWHVVDRWKQRRKRREQQKSSSG